MILRDTDQKLSCTSLSSLQGAEKIEPGNVPNDLWTMCNVESDWFWQRSSVNTRIIVRHGSARLQLCARFSHKVRSVRQIFLSIALLEIACKLKETKDGKIPEHITPLPLYPSLHLHWKEPSVFIQYPLAWQLWVLSAHSSISMDKKRWGFIYYSSHLGLSIKHCIFYTTDAEYLHSWLHHLCTPMCMYNGMIHGYCGNWHCDDSCVCGPGQ